MNNTKVFDIKNSIDYLLKKCTHIEEIYLFGSRAYKTGSLRSDIDILVYAPKGLGESEIPTKFIESYNPIDLFLTTNKMSASSITNGSNISSAKKDIHKKLDAIKLWSSASGFTPKFKEYRRCTILKDIEFVPSALPGIFNVDRIGEVKYQIFLSSTYKDLINERKTAINTILHARHIPAGMEFFPAAPSSQWPIITKWIDESDIYLLILGNRYGSISKETKKSYTEMEYDYALDKNKTVIAILMPEKDCESLKKLTLLKKFREKVKKNRLCSICKKSGDIVNAIHSSLKNIEAEGNISGWTRINF